MNNKIRLSALLIFFVILPLFFISCKTVPSDDFDNGEISYRYRGNRVTVPVKEDVQKIQYDRNLFKRKGIRMTYDGDPRYTYRLGLDISRHDGKKINWKKVRNAGFDFIIFRIGWRGYQSGILHVDEHFHENMKGAIKEGFEIGVYVFSQAINEEEALEEANLVIEELHGYPIRLPVVFDPESIPWEEARTDDISGEQFTKNAIVFCERIKEAGYEPMLYSNIVWEAEFFDLSQLKEYKIWYADYHKIPHTPYHFEFWQYGGEWARVPGFRFGRKVDIDIQMLPTYVE